MTSSRACLCPSRKRADPSARRKADCPRKVVFERKSKGAGRRRPWRAAGVICDRGRGGCWSDAGARIESSLARQDFVRRCGIGIRRIGGSSDVYQPAAGPVAFAVITGVCSAFGASAAADGHRAGTLYRLGARQHGRRNEFIDVARQTSLVNEITHRWQCHSRQYGRH